MNNTPQLNQIYKEPWSPVTDEYSISRESLETILKKSHLNENAIAKVIARRFDQDDFLVAVESESDKKIISIHVDYKPNISISDYKIYSNWEAWKKAEMDKDSEEIRELITEEFNKIKESIIKNDFAEKLMEFKIETTSFEQLVENIKQLIYIWNQQELIDRELMSFLYGDIGVLSAHMYNSNHTQEEQELLSNMWSELDDLIMQALYSKKWNERKDSNTN